MTDVHLGGDGLSVHGVSVVLNTEAGLVTPVSDVSFYVGRGERVALVGESGCGKSLLLRSLLRLVPPSVLHSVAGSARLGGHDLLRLFGDELRVVRGKSIGIVFQDASTYLNPTMPIGRQIIEALRPEIRGDRAAARSRVAELLTSVGLDGSRDFQRRYPHELSGGMRQRVLIAVALAGDPDLLFADEPTTALDVTVQAQILSTVDEVVRRRGMGLLLVTHDLGVVAQLCERMYVMYAGQIVESGKVTEVFTNPQHPYTQALLGCLLSIDRPPEQLRSIPGVVPPPNAYPPGCRFQDRCPNRMAICERPAPDVALGPDRTVRCWLHGAPRPQSASKGRAE